MGSDSDSSSRISGLPSLRFEPNWKVPPNFGREFLASNIGDNLEQVAESLARSIDAASDESDDQARWLYLDARFPRRRGQVAGLLVLSEEWQGHQSATTIYLRKKGADLFVKLSGAAKTRLRYMHWLIRGCLVVCLFFLCYGAYFRATDQRNALLWEYARKYRPDDPSSQVEEWNSGYQLIPSERKVVKVGNPIELWDLIIMDTKIFLMQMSGPPAIILAGLGILIGLVPATALDFVSRVVGWPTSVDFNSFVSAEISSIDAELCRALEDFGITGGDIRKF